MTSQVKLELFERNIEVSLVARQFSHFYGSINLARRELREKLTQEAVIMPVPYCFSYCNFVIYFEQSV